MTGDFYGDTADQQITHSMERHGMSEKRTDWYLDIGRLLQERCFIEDRESQMRSEIRIGMHDAATAGYAAALRDMMSWFADDEWIHDGETGGISESIERFAAERGIDLEDTA